MMNRRSFLVSSGLTAAMSRSAFGANDRIQVGVIGAGTRGGYMSTVLAGNDDCQVQAICDVYKPRRDATAAKLPGEVKTYVDYRHVLERNDIDAVLIAAPDHWHAALMIEACQAGKDVYVEKPACRQIEEGFSMIHAASSNKRVVQVGLQQRSWDHFQQCAKMVHDGKFGTIYHAGLHWRGSYNTPHEEPTDPPDDIDWELFQGPAPRHGYTRGRHRFWRAFYDYAGGIVTDQGVHIGDVVHWYLNAREPLTVTASAQYVNVDNPERDQLPDSFMISWQYDKFIMSFTNGYMPNVEFNATSGNYFYGADGALHVNRSSYTYKATPPRARRGQPQPRAAHEDSNVTFRHYGQPADRTHVRNVLDCVKSRQQPLTNMETGFYSTLPLLLGVLAIRTGKSYRWTGKEAEAM